MKIYRDSIFVNNWRFLSSKSSAFAAPDSISLCNACVKFVWVPFSVLIIWFNEFEKFDWKFDWLMSEFGLMSGCELNKWLFICGSGVNVGYWMFWCIDMCVADVVMTLVFNWFITELTDRKLGTKKMRKWKVLVREFNAEYVWLTGSWDVWR